MALVGSSRIQIPACGTLEGVGQLRLDCYAGDDQALVRTYERFGFVLERPIAVDTGQPEPWPGTVLRMEL